jgi:uncharacterized protein YvpB
MQLTAIVTTYLKPSTKQSSEIAKDQLVGFRKDTSYEISSYTEENNHYLCTFSSPIAGYRRWYVFAPHVSITSVQTVQAHSSPIIQCRKDIKLGVPFYPQYDNYLNPNGSCNVTSIAMSLAYLGVKPRCASDQLEDELYEYMESKGLSRHSPEDLASVVRTYGHKDDFNPRGTFSMIHSHLEEGFPVVVHGYFTRSGHVVCIIGRTASSFVVHDPWGRWTASGYDFQSTGEAEEYNYEDLARLLSPESATPSTATDVWAHFIST